MAGILTVWCPLTNVSIDTYVDVLMPVKLASVSDCELHKSGQLH